MDTQILESNPPAETSKPKPLKLSNNPNVYGVIRYTDGADYLLSSSISPTDFDPVKTFFGKVDIVDIKPGAHIVEPEYSFAVVNASRLKGIQGKGGLDEVPEITADKMRAESGKPIFLAKDFRGKLSPTEDEQNAQYAVVTFINNGEESIVIERAKDNPLVIITG